MDVIKTKKTKPFYQRKEVLIAGAASFFVAALGALQFGDFGQFSIERYAIVSAKVQSGDFKVNVSSSGTLMSRDPRLLSSHVDGRVERIAVYPGDSVKAGQPLFMMSNPDVERRVEELRWEVRATELELAALEQRQKTQLLDFQDQMLSNKLRYDVESLRLKAEDELVTEGQGTVSMIDYEARKLSVSELSKRIEMDNARFEQLGITLASEFEAAKARLERLRKTQEQTEFELASLTISAPADGILQEMNLELGQNVVSGDNVARLAQAGDLIAMLDVPELNSGDVSLGQNVLIDTRFNKINGRVARIDPAVNNGVVQVEVELVGDLPSEARPDLSVTGEISVTEKQNSLYVRRPFKTISNRTVGVFKVSPDGEEATMTKVHFGTLSSTYIEVLSGASVGDELIISDVSEYAQHDEIKIINE